MEGVSRRTVLASLAGGASLVSGCGQVLGRQSADAVRMLGAGSLQRALSTLADAVPVRVRVEARGSAAAAQLVAEGTRDPDVLALADGVLFESVLEPDWYAAMATNELTLAYDGTTDVGRRFEDADRWFDPVLSGAVSLGRTDPDLDPLGYRTLFALDLAGDHYGRPDLPGAARAASDVYPETSLLARLETGAVDAAFVYRNMATDRGYDTVDLPPAIDLSDPARADRYGTVSCRLPDGTRVSGGVIEYVATVRKRRPASMRVFEALIAGDALADHGFRRPDRYPTFEGDVPDGLA